jgi:hypothetical protein
MATIQGWGRETWGSAAWNEYSTISVTGQQANGSIGTGFSVVTSQVISVTGQGANANPGNATATGIAQVSATGEEATADVGTPLINSGHVIFVTGQEATSALGDTTESLTMTTGWNRDTDINTGASIGWGDQQWGAEGLSNSVTGEEATADTSGVQSVTANADISPASQVGTFTIGAYAISGDGNTTIAVAPEHELDAELGTGYTINIYIDATVTGIAATSSVGTVIAPALAMPTGVSATAGLGDVEQETIYTVTGVSATSAVGDAGSSGGSSYQVTGNQLTSSVGSLRITNWSVIDDSQTADWKNVSLAA